MVPAKGTLTVNSVDEVRIRSKATNKDLDFTLTVSRWHDGGAVGNVRLGTRRGGLTQRGSDRLAIIVRSHVVAEMEYGHREDLRSEGKRVSLVLRS